MSVEERVKKALSLPERPLVEELMRNTPSLDEFQPIGEKYLANQKEYPIPSYEGEAPEDVLKALVTYAPMLVLYGYTTVPEGKARTLPQGRWKVPSQGVEVTVTRTWSGIGIGYHVIGLSIQPL